MAIEIEKKFLVDKKQWADVMKPAGEHYRQGYLSIDPEKTVRIRITNTKGFLTIKGISTGASRAEYEYEIPPEDAKEILDNLADLMIDKVRYKISFKNKLWEVDEFKGENAGLILAEIELKEPDEFFEIPVWAALEVTGDKRYYNAYLAKHPYQNW